ncbi:NUDIX domain-containing protein [Dongia sp.]|uniref:NUDIX hydrolase n=1 Tax=Dongia sp. TaxID=1977262 RepID=UPI0035B4BE22
MTTPRPGGTRSKNGRANGDPHLFDRPLVTVDVVILALRERRLCALLAKRSIEPFLGAWALPGGYIHPDEDTDLDAAARRILREKTGAEAPYLEQLQAFGNRRRDPRGWTATFAYFALVDADSLSIVAGPGTTEVAWRDITDKRLKSGLAFDHAEILSCAAHRLRAKVEYTSLPVHLLPEKFTLPDLQQVYEDVLGRRIDKSAFRKRMATADFLEPIAGERRMASHRPAQIYRVKRGMRPVFFDRTI